MSTTADTSRAGADALDGAHGSALPQVTGMPAAPQKTGSGPIGVVGPVLAVLLLALAVLLGREAAVGLGWLQGEPWLPSAAQALDGLGAQTWMIAAGIVVALVGLWLLVTALRPRSRKTLPVTAETGVFVHTSDVARLASAAAREVDGVLSAKSSATRSSVAVHVEALSPEVSSAVQQQVTDRLRALRSTVRVKVKVSTPSRSTTGDRS